MITSCPPSWWNPNHCSAHGADTNCLFLLHVHFCEVELGRLFVGDVIFIIIIIINIIVSLPSCLLFYESKVLDTSPRGGRSPRRRTDGGGGREMTWGEGGEWKVWDARLFFGTTVTVLLAGRLLASVHFFFFFFPCKYFLPIYRSNIRQREKKQNIGVLYIYCTIPSRAEMS